MGEMWKGNGAMAFRKVQPGHKSHWAKGSNPVISPKMKKSTPRLLTLMYWRNCSFIHRL